MKRRVVRACLLMIPAILGLVLLNGPSAGYRGPWICRHLRIVQYKACFCPGPHGCDACAAAREIKTVETSFETDAP